MKTLPEESIIRFVGGGRRGDSDFCSRGGGRGLGELCAPGGGKGGAEPKKVAIKSPQKKKIVRIFYMKNGILKAIFVDFYLNPGKEFSRQATGVGEHRYVEN